jgi:hypothetical protein
MLSSVAIHSVQHLNLTCQGFFPLLVHRPHFSFLQNCLVSLLFSAVCYIMNLCSPFSLLPVLLVCKVLPILYFL